MKFDNPRPFLYPLPIMPRRKHLPRVLFLVVLTAFVLAIGVLPAACCRRQPYEAYLCYTPASASLGVGESLQVVATLQPRSSSRYKNCIEGSGWRWTWDSDDGGKIEFSQSELQWSPPSDGIYMAQVQCTAMQVGTVSLKIAPPTCGLDLDFMGTFSCIDSCTITVTATPFIW